MLTSELVPCFVQSFSIDSKTGYEKALLVGIYDKSFTDLDRCISSSNEVCGYSIGDMRWNHCPKCGAAIVDD